MRKILIGVDLAAQYWNSLRHGRTVLCMTLDEAREEVISGIDYAAYKEMGSSLHDADKNRLFGSEHYKSGRPVYKPSPWAEGNFEDKMATLLRMANALNGSVPAFRLPAITAGRQRLFWGCVGGWPIDDHTDLGRIVSFGPRHDEGLPIGTHIITGNGGAPLELAIE